MSPRSRSMIQTLGMSREELQEEHCSIIFTSIRAIDIDTSDADSRRTLRLTGPPNGTGGTLRNSLRRLRLNRLLCGLVSSFIQCRFVQFFNVFFGCCGPKEPAVESSPLNSSEVLVLFSIEFPCFYHCADEVMKDFVSC